METCTVYIDPEVSRIEILTVKQLNSNEEKDLTEGDWTVSFNRSRTVVGTGDNGKRKQTSPIQSETILRLRREDGGSSPI